MPTTFIQDLTLIDLGRYSVGMSSSIPSIVTVLSGAITTGIVGNYFVQRWQRRNWFEQQRQLIHQQELEQLKELYDRVTETAEARLHAMRRLLSAIGEGDDEIKSALEGYREQLATWNSSLRSFFPPMTLHYGWSATLELENGIHGRFVSIGRSLEAAVRVALKGEANPPDSIATLQDRLNGQAGQLSTFYTFLADGIERRRDEVLNGKRHQYCSGAFHQFSTGDLIKATFAANIDSFDVVRPA